MYIKKFSISILLIFLMILVGCTSKEEKEKANNIENAHINYEQENYDIVIDLIEQYIDSDSELEKMYNISVGCVAYNEKRYEDAIDILGKEDHLSDSQKSMLSDSYKSVYESKINESNLADILNECNDIDFDKENVDRFAIDWFSECYESETYEEYIKADDMLGKIDDKCSIKKDIMKIQETSKSNRALAFIMGEWVRKDGTNFDGSVIDVSVNQGNISGIINDISNIKNNIHGLSENDLKWKDGQIIDELTFSFEDLSLGDNPSYHPSVATIDYKNEQINIHVSGADDESYYLGKNQVWIKKEKVEKYSNIRPISADDYKVKRTDDTELIDNYNSDYLDYFLNTGSFDNSSFCMLKNDGKHDNKELVLTNRDIELGSTLEDVLSAYGIGETNDVNLDEDYYYNGFYDPDSLQNIYDKFKYYYNYLYKEDNEIRGQITFYFDDEDKVISIVYEYGDVETLYKK